MLWFFYLNILYLKLMKWKTMRALRAPKFSSKISYIFSLRFLYLINLKKMVWNLMVLKNIFLQISRLINLIICIDVVIVIVLMHNCRYSYYRPSSNQLLTECITLYIFNFMFPKEFYRSVIYFQIFYVWKINYD